MSAENGKPVDPVELASLAADDPVRRQFAERLAAASEQEREMWQGEWAVSDRLRELLPQVEAPAGWDRRLEGRLLAIPAGQGEAGSWRRMVLHPNWRHAAACVLIAGMVALYFLWPRSPGGGASAVKLDETVGRSIATWAVKNHEAVAQVAVASSDPAAVQKALAGQNFDFPVLMLQPSEGVTLQGGGACDFGTARAAYTRWEGSGGRYTLYEFNGADVGAPRDFLAATERPRELWHGDAQYRVVVWPGAEGKCCWALVIEKEDAKNIFAKHGYRS